MTIESRWDFRDPAVTETRLREAIHAGAGDTVVLRTQLARALGLQRRFDEARGELDALEPALATASGEARVFHALERGRVLNSSGERDRSSRWFLEALKHAESAGLDNLAADAAHMLAIVEPPERQIEWAQRAIAIAERSDDPRARRWIAPVENNLAWTLHDLGQAGEALAHFERALAERERTGEPMPLHIARWSVARCLRTLERHAEALDLQRALERDTAAAGEEDGYVFEELGELLFALGREAEARPYFALAHAALVTERGLDPVRLVRLLRLGDVKI